MRFEHMLNVLLFLKPTLGLRLKTWCCVVEHALYIVLFEGV